MFIKTKVLIFYVSAKKEKLVKQKLAWNILAKSIKNICDVVNWLTATVIFEYFIYKNKKVRNSLVNIQDNLKQFGKAVKDLFLDLVRFTNCVSDEIQ